MTVFLVCGDSAGRNHESAEQFGTIERINHRYVHGDETDADRIPVQFNDKLVLAAAKFNPDDDYLLIDGDHLQLVAFAAMLGVEHGRFRVLRWDRNAKGYFPVMVTT